MDLIYPKHKHPHGVKDVAPDEYRVWVCEECKHIFLDNEIREDNENWGHICKSHPCRKGQRCESHLESYMPEMADLYKPEEVLLSDEEILIIFRKCGGRNNPAICDYDKEITQAQALKSQLFHKAERDKERRMIFEEIEIKCPHSNPHSYWTPVKNCPVCMNALKAKYGGEDA